MDVEGAVLLVPLQPAAGGGTHMVGSIAASTAPPLLLLPMPRLPAFELELSRRNRPMTDLGCLGLFIPPSCWGRGRGDQSRGVVYLCIKLYCRLWLWGNSYQSISKAAKRKKERNKVEEITEKRENRKKTNNNLTTRDSHNYRLNFASISVLVLTQCLVHLTNRRGNYIGRYRRYTVVLYTCNLRHIYTCFLFFFSCLSNFEKNQTAKSKPKSKTETVTVTEPETVHSVSYLTQHSQTY